MTDDSGNVTGDSGHGPKIGHVQSESAVTFGRNDRSRSNGISGQLRPEYAEATLRRARAAESSLDTATSDRLYRLSKLIAIAEEVLENATSAKTWLHRPQPGLEGRVPLELLVTQAGADQVESLLRRIDYGVYA